MKRHQIRKRKSSKIQLLRRVAKEGGWWTFERLIAESRFFSEDGVSCSGSYYYLGDVNSLVQRLSDQKIPFEINEDPIGCLCVSITQPRSQQ